MAVILLQYTLYLQLCSQPWEEDGDQWRRMKQQAVCATVPKVAATITAVNSDASSKLAAGRARSCPDSQAKRWLRCEDAVACRESARSGTASFASAETRSVPWARWMTISSQESSR